MSDGVVLIGHGTVERLDELPGFLANIRHGHAAPPELIQEVRRRYEAIGGKSPLNDISRRLARKVEEIIGLPVRMAMRLAPPRSAEVLGALADAGVDRIAVVPLAQHSAHVYRVAVGMAAATLGRPMAVLASENWGQTPALVEAYAAELRATLAECPDPARARVVMTAHSLPLAVIRRGDAYEREVRASADAVAARALDAGMPPVRTRVPEPGHVARLRRAAARVAGARAPAHARSHRERGRHRRRDRADRLSRRPHRDSLRPRHRSEGLGDRGSGSPTGVPARSTMAPCSPRRSRTSARRLLAGREAGRER